MEILIASDEEKFEAQRKLEVLEELEPLAEELMDRHIEKQKMWVSNDFLPADEQEKDWPEVLASLRERAKGIVDPVRVSLVLNLLTEEGLPHFHRLIARSFSKGSVWRKWNFLWTAEEDRHGNVLRDYLRDARFLKFSEVELMQYAYQNIGFCPDWEGDAYKLLVYTSLQERATQFAHQNTSKAVGNEPILNKLLARVAADEAHHFNFYRNMFKGIIELDPNHALKSAVALLPSIDMPGFKMPGFKEMAEVIRKANIYGPRDYKKIVDEAIDFWKIETLTGLNEVGRAAQEKIMKIPARLQRVSEYIERRTKKKSFSFKFTYDRILEI